MNKQTMTIDTYTHFLESLRQYCRTQKIEIVNFIWHGGEPTLMPLPFYKKAKELQMNILESEGIAAFNTIQTNMTLETDRIEGILKSLNIKNIGTSYDPDGLRSLRSDDFRKRWLLNYMRLKGRYGIGAIYVINKKTLGREKDILAHFTNMGVDNIKLNWMYKSLKNPHVDEYIPSPEEWGESFVRFIKFSARFPVVITELRDFRLKTFSCAFTGAGSCMQRFIGISPEGNIYNCGRMMELDLAYGNINDGPIEDIFSNSRVRRLMSQRCNDLLEGECSDCNYWEFCHGGCACDSYLSTGKIIARTNMCEGYKKIFVNHLHGGNN